jgi:hypothetical protein
LPALFDDLFQQKISAFGTLRHDRRGMPWDIGPKSLKMKRGYIATWVRGTLRAVPEKTGGMCTFWQTWTLPLLKEISPKNLARLSNVVLQKTTVHTWSLWTSQTEWSTAMELPR